MTDLSWTRPASRVLAFGAHPDDLEVGAGGLLARLVRQGASVVAAVVSVPSELDDRVREAEAGARVLGVELALLNRDKRCRVEDLPMYELVRQLDAIVNDVRPDLVVTHSAHDLHWDHGLVHRATVSSLRRWSCDLLAYLSSYEMNAQLSSRAMGPCFADVSDTIETKLEAIRAHRTQLPKMDVESTRDLARAMGRLAGVDYAEAYEVLRLRF
ncbi:MAG TPA: PIG-L family deacetylase [Polyangia bacterium]